MNSSSLTPDPFLGFKSPNYTLIPKAVADSIMQDLTTGELRCLLYILGRTFGWKKPTDQISLSQFLNGIQSREGEVKDLGVGLQKPALLKSLASLQEKKLIHRKRRMTRMGDCAATEFSLNLFIEKNSNPAKPWPWKRSAFFQVPDELLNFHLPDLTGRELKVLLFIARWTSHTENQVSQISIHEMTQGIRKEGKVLSKGTGITDSKNLMKHVRLLESKKMIFRKIQNHVSKGYMASQYSLFIEEEGVENIPTHRGVEILPTQGVQTMPTNGVEKNPTLGVKKESTHGVQIEPHTNTTFTKEYLNTTSRELTLKFYLSLGIKPSTKKIEKEKGVMFDLLERDKFTSTQIENSFVWVKRHYPDTAHINRFPMLIGLALRGVGLTQNVIKRLESNLDETQKNQEKTKKLIQEFEKLPEENQKSRILKAPKFFTGEAARKAWALSQFQKELENFSEQAGGIGDSKLL
jgi:hypothetical protein